MADKEHHDKRKKKGEREPWVDTTELHSSRLHSARTGTDTSDSHDEPRQEDNRLYTFETAYGKGMVPIPDTDTQRKRPRKKLHRKERPVIHYPEPKKKKKTPTGRILARPSAGLANIPEQAEFTETETEHSEAEHTETEDVESEPEQVEPKPEHVKPEPEREVLDHSETEPFEVPRQRKESEATKPERRKSINWIKQSEPDAESQNSSIEAEPPVASEDPRQLHLLGVPSVDTSEERPLNVPRERERTPPVSHKTIQPKEALLDILDTEIGENNFMSEPQGPQKPQEPSAPDLMSLIGPEIKTVTIHRPGRVHEGPRPTAPKVIVLKEPPRHPPTDSERKFSDDSPYPFPFGRAMLEEEDDDIDRKLTEMLDIQREYVERKLKKKKKLEGPRYKFPEMVQTLTEAGIPCPINEDFGRLQGMHSRWDPQGTVLEYYSPMLRTFVPINMRYLGLLENYFDSILESFEHFVN